jgi:hypothetical protein
MVREMTVRLPPGGTVGNGKPKGGASYRDFLNLLHESVTVGLTEVLGSAGARAAMFHLALEQSADAAEVHRGLAGLFGAGAESLESSVLRVLFSRVGSEFSPDGDASFVSRVSEAEDAYSKRRPRRSQP